MESLGAAAIGSRRYGPVDQRRQPINPHGQPLLDGGVQRSGGFRPLSATSPVSANQEQLFCGYDAHTRHNIVQIFFGCHNVMIYAAEGHVELLLSMDPSGNWQPITPDAAEGLGQQLLDAADRARATAGHERPE